MKRAHVWATSTIFFLGPASTSCIHYNGLNGFEKNPTVFNEADGDFPARRPLAVNEVIVAQSPPSQDWHRVGTIEVGSNCEDDVWDGTTAHWTKTIVDLARDKGAKNGCAIVALEAPRETCSRGSTIVKASHPGIAYDAGCFAR